MSKKNKEGFETRAIHAGQKADPTTGAVMMPIYTSSTYEQESPGVHKGFDYSRSINPTRKAFEECIASLENGEVGFGFSSGVAAISACVELLSPGDHVIAMNDLYGGTVRLFNEIKTISQGIEVTYVDMTDMQNVLEAKTDKTKMIFVETPTNPLLRVVDLSAIADFAKAENILSVCDNTFASPYVQQPLNHGIDIVLHSATKYLGGHSDLIAGALVIGKKDDALVSKMANIVNSLGPITGAFDSYLILRSLKTLAVRMERHCENARSVAEFLNEQSSVDWVRYPGMNDGQASMVEKYLGGKGGAMVVFGIKGGKEAGQKFIESLELFSHLANVGDAKSLAIHPATTTHSQLDDAALAAAGVTPGYVRLSIGIEHPDDIIADIKQALAA